MQDLNNNDLEKISGGCGIGAVLPSFLEGYIAPPPNAFVGTSYEDIKKSIDSYGKDSDAAKRNAYWWRSRNRDSTEYLDHKEEIDAIIGTLPKAPIKGKLLK